MQYVGSVTAAKPKLKSKIQSHDDNVIEVRTFEITLAPLQPSHIGSFTYLQRVEGKNFYGKKRSTKRMSTDILFVLSSRSYVLYI